MKIENVTFVYKEGRVSRLNSSEKFPKEFFYAYQNFSKDCKNVEIIEYHEDSNIILKLIFKVIRKFSKQPIYPEKLINIKNLRTFLKTDFLIQTNQNIGYSMIFIILVLKLFKRLNTTVFIMGVLEFQEIETFNKRLFNKLLFKANNNVIFLSNNEKIYAESHYEIYKDKFYFLPFPVDIKFWNRELKIEEFNRKIIFLGNDLNRNYELLKNLPKKLPTEDFVYITERILESEVFEKNLILKNGSWGNSHISDIQIKEFYNDAKLVILPLHNSMQPSGQSVSLQAMSMKVPVLISKTDGFWDYEKFIDHENIFFIESGNTDEWVEKIKYILNEKNDELINKAHTVVKEYYNLEVFYRDLLLILNKK